MGFWNIRSLLLAAFVLSNSITWTVSKHHYTHNVLGHRSRHRRQGAGLFLSGSYVIPAGEGSGPWGEWGEVSPCSRTCGGGVASQKRICLEVDPYGRPQCTGADTKYFSCETQDCPEGSKDFRAEQCSEYDNQPFRGVTYSKWVPYTRAPNPCLLTCMPHAERFYRPIKNVIDGTRCHDDSFDVCVNGTCQPVGCDMMLGSNAQEDKCRECRGNGTNCRTVTGLVDTQDLRQGYNDILLIPQGSTTISIQEKRPSNNYLAIRGKTTNEYYLNGHYHISSPQTFPIAGSNCRYDRSELGYAAVDILKCLGPINETLYLSLLLLQDDNVGIEYEYSLPTSLAPPPDQEYAWVHDEFSPCSATCGGGIQTRKVTCRSREELEEVEDRLCDINLKPATNQICGSNPCQARWVEGPWSDCSKPCGQGGVRSRQVHCEKIISNGNPSLVNDEECFGLLGPKPEIFQECNKDAACPSWFTGPWKPCDKLIGEGKQTRQVVCHQKIDGKVEVLAEDACTDKKPPAEQPCLLHPSEGVDWVLSDWAGCDNCLSKTRSRIAECVTKDRNIVNASFCAYHPTPILEEKCDENELPACTFQWYATQWSNCSVECGKGVQTRRVFCGRFNGESVSKVDDEKCESEDKYKETKDCEVPEEKCPAKWFAGPWTECSKMCGRGERHRKIMCLSRGKVVKTCDPETILDEDETCNDIPCDEDETLPLDSRTTPIIDDDEDYDEDCEDEEYVDTPKDWDLMFSDSPSTTDEGSGESTLFTESESDLTSETGSGTETTFETSSDTSLSTETGSTESSSDYDTTEIITTESGLTEDTSITSSESDVTLSSSTETITTDETVTESSTTSDSETQSSESTATGITESDATTETGTTESDSSETTETGTTGSDSFETTETGTTESDSSETTEMGTTGSDSSETTETGTTESDSSETTETGTTETDSSETTETGITESDSSATTETATTELDSSETTETGTTESDSFDTSETVTTELESSETTVTDTTDSDNSASTETGSTESGSTDTTESATTEIDSSETTETGTTESEISESTESGSTGSEITDITDTSTDASNTGSTEETSSESSSESTTEIGSTDTADTSSTGADDTSSTESTITDSVATDETESTETEDTSGTDESTTPWDWTTVVEEFTKRPRKCKRRKAPKCKKSTFGCCPDEITPAAGPFDGGCPTFTTCKETKFGCCPDGVSQARGPNNHGCPISQCKETLYGCCKSDKKTPAEGNNQEGCPPPPPACKSSKNGCCKDGKTAAKGPKGKGCPENKPDIKDTEATLNDCAESEFGCCFDNETQATGPNEEGCPCNATEFNCCPDGITPARGLQMEGCVTSCNTTEFGCCPDNETPAHGPEQEGCCLQYAFGCCPDNYKPAEGPHLEGCECQHAHFGCCPDNKTIARGPGNEGCGCQHTQHGCCPDRHTEATGPDFEGCACHTFQFGCCPDGVTKSTGPGLTGCRCQYSQYGCCGDDETAATGPNKEGCNCANSKFGCCPDGETEAKGEKFLGCTDKPENRQAACALATDRGPCHNYTVYWFYDKEYGGCSRFWYGGCGGNGNKFVSNEECQNVCVQPSPKEACQLPKVHGACESYIPKWYYDTEREQCGQFIYGGCLGNANNFETRDACRSQCEPARDEDTCTPPIESGSCAGSYERWGFNAQAGRCERFVWGGCEGNTNKFTTEAACIQRCDPPGAQKPQCSVPQDVGNCTSKIATWSFSETENRCVPFYYSGCGGNENRFTREQDCTQACPTIPVQDVCTKPASVGDCADYREKWYYDTAVKRCRPFYYGGCGGNGNNFNSEQECENSCSENALTTTTNPPPPRYDQEYCFLELDPGPCNMMRTMYGYDSSLGRCVAFQYGGCGGNTNNFERIEDCERYCSNAQDVCQLPKSTGECRASITMWYYDASSDSCRQFQYGGCDGNANRFESRGDCERRCRAAPIAPTTPTPVRATTQAVSQECRTPDSLTPCGENITVFYYDAERRECLGGYFGGCRYTNSYRSSEECERRCGAFRDQDVCAAQKDPGPCRAAVPKFYFDRASSRCLEFTYGGCYGSSNRFSTQDECEEVCGIPETDPCQLQPEPGNCLEAVEMWYYDANRDQCGQFYYSGCQGNGNRFNSQAECEGRCRSRAPLVTTVPPAQQSSEECRTPASLAPCGENITVFYYDAEKQQCLSGSFGGCRYANSYRSSEECERRCGAFRDIDVCAAQVDPGPCRDNITKFYFDSASGRCTEFGYGGCYGSSNRFSTQDECKEVCGGAGPEPDCSELEQECASLRCEYSVQRTHTADGCEKCTCVTVDVDCTPLIEQCATLKCHYEIDKVMGPDGCERCRCTEHPCEKVHCPSGERCVAIPYRDPITQAVKYNANCKMVNKPGVCAAEEARDNLAASSCRRECNDDADCDDAGKCCARGCSQLCESPAMPTSAAPTTLPPTRPTPPIYPELPQAPQANLEATEPEVSSSEGGKATLRCFFHGNPPPTITWRRGEITIDGNVGRYRILSDGTLEIVSLYRNDTGVYICVGDNGLGTAKQEVRLQVTDPVDREAEIAGEDNASETGELGQPLTLRCLAYGYPAPSINWYHGPNGGTMVPFDSVLYETTRDGHLLIRSLNLETLGEYSCHAYNGQGRATSWNVMVRAWAPLGYRNYANNPYIYEREVQVTPRPPTTQPTQPPTTTPPPIFTAPVHTRIMSESGTVAAGSELSLPCEVDGYPAPRVHWTKDGSLLSPSARITITDARLTIAGLREDDSGEYGCHARNDYSSYDSTISIQVRGITIPEQCTDNPFFANCHLIVKSNFCTHSYYSKFCCKSCVEAGQLNPALLRLDETWQYRK